MFRWHADLSGNIVQEDYSPRWKSAINFSAEPQQRNRFFDPVMGPYGLIGSENPQFIDMTYYWAEGVDGLSLWAYVELGNAGSGFAMSIDEAQPDWSPLTDISIDFYPTYFGTGYDHVVVDPDTQEESVVHSFYQKIESMTNNTGWHTVAATLSNTQSKLYLDGVLVGTAAASPFYPFTDYFRFNAASPTGNAIMGAAAGWGRVLSVEEIADLTYNHHAGLLVPPSMKARPLGTDNYRPGQMWIH